MGIGNIALLAGLAVLVLVTGCNLAFGLEETITVDAAFIDFDGDGVTDSKDDCPLVANSDQLDSDGDGFGNACDTCPTTASASTHDEDGDTVGDACDLCPGISDFGDDKDLDGIGDLCDPAPAVPGNTRVALETFTTMPAEWQASGVSWTSAGDATAPSASLPASDDGLTNTSINAVPPWTVTVGMESTDPWGMGEQAGVEARVSGHTLRCRADCDAGVCRVSVYVDGTQFAANYPYVPRPFSRLTFYVRGSAISCVSEGVGGATIAPAGLNATTTFSLIASPNIHITYFEYLE